MNFTLSKTYGQPRRYETQPETVPPHRFGLALLLSGACWIAIGCAIWSLCK